jgi:hypothetical protein
MSRTRLRGFAVLLLAVACMAVPTRAALAHACPDCIRPKRGAPGTTVRMWTGLKVIWNPNSRQDHFGLLRDVHHADEPSLILFRSQRVPKSSWFRFRVPDVAPGTYGIAQYDGSEGGTHYNHAYFTVLPTAQRNATPTGSDTTRDRDGVGISWLWPVTAAAVAVLVASMASLWRRARHSGRR